MTKVWIEATHEDADALSELDHSSNAAMPGSPIGVLRRVVATIREQIPEPPKRWTVAPYGGEWWLFDGGSHTNVRSSYQQALIPIADALNAQAES